MLYVSIYLVLLKLSMDCASLNSELCTAVNERPGECPKYAAVCTTPYPLWLTRRKYFSCICDTDCKVNYKCCRDSCYHHGICKPVVFIPITTIKMEEPLQVISPVVSSTASYMCEEEHPGQCPPYSIKFITPIPIRLSWHKPYKCRCDSNCKVNYKCCEDSYFAHGVCKPAERIPATTVKGETNSFKAKISGKYTTLNYQEKNLINKYTYSVADERGSGMKTSHPANSEDYIYFDDEDLIFSGSVQNTQNSNKIQYSGSGQDQNNYSGSGDFSGDVELDRFAGGINAHVNNEHGSGIGNVNSVNTGDLIFIDDEHLIFSGSGENKQNSEENDLSSIDQNLYNYSGSGDFNRDDELESFSGSGHETDDEYNVFSNSEQTKRTNISEEVSGSGIFRPDDDEIVGSGYIKNDVYDDEELGRFSGSGLETDNEYDVFPNKGHNKRTNISEEISGSGIFRADDEQNLGSGNNNNNIYDDEKLGRFSGSGHETDDEYDEFPNREHSIRTNITDEISGSGMFRADDDEKMLGSGNNKNNIYDDEELGGFSGSGHENNVEYDGFPNRGHNKRTDISGKNSGSGIFRPDDDEKMLGSGNNKNNIYDDEELARFSGSGHENNVEYDEFPNRGHNKGTDISEEISGSGIFRFDDNEEILGSGNNKIDIYDDDDIFSGSGHNKRVILYEQPSGNGLKITTNSYEGSGHFRHDSENERFSGSGQKQILFGRRNFNNDGNDKYSGTGKNKVLNLIIDPEDFYFTEHSASNNSYDTEQLINE